MHRTQDDQKVFIDEFGNRASLASNSTTALSVDSGMTHLSKRKDCKYKIVKVKFSNLFSGVEGVAEHFTDYS